MSSQPAIFCLLIVGGFVVMPFFNVHFFEVFLKNFLKKLLTTISWSKY